MLASLKVLQKQMLDNPYGSDVDINTIPAWARRLRDVALAVVQCDGKALQHLDDSFRSDRHIVIAAVRSDGDAFQHASEDLREDEDVVLSGFRGQRVFTLASPALLSNKPFVLTLVQRWGLYTQACRCIPAGRQGGRHGGCPKRK